ncbi:DUF1275 domain-containing protein [Corallococcus sp. H22C18031201]|uniref:YoaK family protein n=1 Tax=Citreicoccus inhibens TaxID=2849499 RepID=UPI000E74984E|nr:YoaK family protein [Citreicoccus inhibens]MBU8895591.1 DUF1275 domain-containing protein [Citreicoccus inhibens]RJS22391.1 DUF1275 domain-containing protein [Corallococcus sp. H22C18031201]
MPFSTESTPSSRRAYSILSLLLASVAGSVNATGFVALGMHTSHMTGNTAGLGEALASGQWTAARLTAQLLGSFVLGAVCASVLLDASRHRTRGRHSAALVLETSTLGGIALWLWFHPGAHAVLPLWSLAFAMGQQNALVTRVSGAVVRTTHMTGILTDIGIQLVQMGAWVRDGARGRGTRGLLHRLRELPSAIQFERTRLHLGLLGAFLLGSTLGPLLFLHYGAATLALPCALLALLVVLDFSSAAMPHAHAAPHA